MNEEKFWETIELAWSDAPKFDTRRRDALESNDEDLLEDIADDLNRLFLENYVDRLQDLSKDELTAYIRIFESKLYQLDRLDTHEFTDGSDDGFLYCRCFIVALGREYFEAVDKNPSHATFDLEAESVGFAMYRAYEEMFGEEFERNLVHCIESGSNPEGWPEN